VKITTVVPRRLIFHCAAEINQPRYAAQWEIARIGQEEQFASRKTSRSQLTIEYKAKQEIYTAAEGGLRWRPKQRRTMAWTGYPRSPLRVGSIRNAD
jgi:hypothetical protein